QSAEPIGVTDAWQLGIALANATVQVTSIDCPILNVLKSVLVLILTMAFCDAGSSTISLFVTGSTIISPVFILIVALPWISVSWPFVNFSILFCAKAINEKLNRTIK